MTVRKAAEHPGASVTFDADALYLYANSHDGDPTPHDGTTVRAGFQAVVAVGELVTQTTDVTDEPVGQSDKLSSYLWAATVDQGEPEIDVIKTWVLTLGPVWVGTDWYNDMFTPDAGGRLHPTGGIAGGHAWKLRGYDSSIDMFVMRNSWGAWGGTASDDGTRVAMDPTGATGDALISSGDLAMLLSGNGEAGAAVDTVVPAPAPGPAPSPAPGPSPTPPPHPGPPPQPPIPIPPSHETWWQEVLAWWAKVEQVLGARPPAPQ
jgi:hypothetical protein